MAKTVPLFALRQDLFATSDNLAAFKASCKFAHLFNISRILVSLSLIPLTKWLTNRTWSISSGKPGNALAARIRSSGSKDSNPSSAS